MRWTLMRDGEIVGSGVRFRVVGDVAEIVARAHRDSAGQARGGDRLSVFLDGALLAEEIVRVEPTRETG